MKQLFATAALIAAMYFPVAAQQVEKDIKEEREIIIRNGDKDAKEQREIIIRNNGKDADLRVNFNGDKVTINGKNISEFKDSNIVIRDRRIVVREGRRATNQLADVLRFNDDMMKSSTTKQTYLGVGMAEDGKGVKVEMVEKGSPAEKSGLKVGDIITTINDKKMGKPADLSGLIQDAKENDQVSIKYLRNGKKITTNAKLGVKEVVKNQMVFIGPDGRRNEFNMPQMPEMREFNFNFGENGLPFNTPQPRIFNMGSGEKLGIKVSDLETGDGVKVTAVDKDSKAERAGIQTGDVIVSIDGNPVKNVNDARMKLNIFLRDSFKISLTRAGVAREVIIPKTVRTAEL